MRKIPIFLTLLLMGAWAYTSWYWYTCNIKGFCENSQVYREEFSQKRDETDMFQQASVIGDETDEAEKDMGDSTFTGGISSSEKLSADDVLSEYIERDENEENNTQEESLSGTLLSSEDGGQIDENLTENITEQGEEKGIESICTQPLVGPIGIERENDSDEVKRLEKFLNSQGESLAVDGIYGQEDFQAVNRFQLKYRAEILDPWGITNPTGYVFRTTVKTMNAVACGEIYGEEDGMMGEKQQNEISEEKTDIEDNTTMEEVPQQKEETSSTPKEKVNPEPRNSRP